MNDSKANFSVNMAMALTNSVIHWLRAIVEREVTEYKY